MTGDLDFIVGGMPRGGTTALSVVFNLHPLSFCYAAESHLIPLLLEFAADAPAPAGSLGGLRKILEAQNHQVLIDMPRQSVQAGASDRWVIFDEPAVAEVNRGVMGLLERQLFGRELCEAALRHLAGVIREKSGKAIVGEKTPSNVFAFREYGTIGTKLAPVLVREPYAVIRSMKKRGEDANDKYNGPFQGELVELIGLYLSYLEAVRDAKDKANVMVVKYEDLMESSTDIVRKMYATIGLPEHPRAVELAVKSLRLRSGATPWDKFSPSDRALIWHLTESLRNQMGYTADFYKSQGFAPTEDELRLACDDEMLLPVFGFHTKHPSEGGTWLMKESCIAFQVRNGQNLATLKFWSEFPKAIAPDGTSITLSAMGFDSPAVIASASVGRKAAFSTLAFDLNAMTPVHRGTNGSIYLVKLVSSHAYRRTVTPVSRLGNIFFGGDRRQLSFNLVESKFS
ncbi:MAG: sulfotransferase [Hyphomicrobium sp.]